MFDSSSTDSIIFYCVYMTWFAQNIGNETYTKAMTPPRFGPSFDGASSSPDMRQRCWQRSLLSRGGKS